MGKKVFLSLLVWLLFFSVSVGGETLSDIEVLDLSGETVQTADFFGQYVIFDIWATWCPPCVVAMKDYQSNWEVFEQEQINLVAISVDDGSATVKDFIKKHAISFTVLHDLQNAVSQWQIRALPTMIVVAPDGTILLRKKGYASFQDFWEQVISVINEHREIYPCSVAEEEDV